MAIRAAAREQGVALAGARVAVQGFGKAGSTLARLLHRQGARVVAISDSAGGIGSAPGLDPEQVLAHKAKTGSVVKFPGSKPVSSAELLAIDCEILVPAALETQITMANAREIKAAIVCEAANGPTTPGADEILFKKGVFVIPDILANAGGVTVSYFEWVQSLQSFFWSEQEVYDRLDDVMTRAFSDVHSIARSRKIDMRTAAYVLGVGRVAEAMRVRGIYP